MQESGTAGQNSGVVEVYWGGKLISTIQGNNTTNWETFKVTVIGGAGDGSNRIEFKEVGEGFDNWGIAIDNVSLVGLDTPIEPENLHIVSDINISDVDDANLESAKVVLTNYKAGDVIVVNDLPSGITATIEEINGELVVKLTGTATVSTYENAIESLTFNSTSVDVTPREFEINVNDGSKDSNIINLSLNVEGCISPDTVPTSVDETQNIVFETNSPITTNIIITLDISGSMTSNDEHVNRLALAKETLENIISEYDNYGDVNVKLVTFSDQGNASSWMNASDAIDYINSLSAGGWTNYEDALFETYNNYSEPVADQTVAYFISDGEPNKENIEGCDSWCNVGDDRESGWLDSPYVNAWNNFVDTYVDQLNVVAMGSGISDTTYLDVIAGVADGDFSNTIVVNDSTQLNDTLLGTVNVVETKTVSGNLLDNVDFNTDGAGGLVSIQIDGVIYTSTTFPTDGITTLNGGKLVFNFTSGDYTYTAVESNYTSDISETFKLVAIDSDNDTTTFNLTINVDVPEVPTNSAPDAVDDLSHNISGIVLVSENFENGTAQGWTNNTVTTVGEQKTGELTEFLGRFGGTCGSESISKTFDFGIENAGNTVTIEFDMYEIDSWDGEHFKVFTNGKEVSSNAMYWDDCNGNKDGGKATNNNEFTGYGAEEIHHYSLQATVDKNGHVKLGFGSTLDQGIADESWGIDNVTITANNGWKTNSTNEDTAITVDVLANDTDPENDVLSITHIQGQDITNGQTINIVNAGIVVGTAQVVNGQIVFTPGDELQKLNNGDNQSVVFDYSITDGNGGSDSANVSINVTGVTDIVVTPINATLCGTKDIAEGNSGWYNVQLDKAVTQDTWVTVQVYDGTAYRVDANGCEQQNQDIIWGGYFDTRDSYGRVVDIYYDQVPNSATSIAYGTRPQVGPDYATWDFTVEKDGFVQNGGVITLLIKAGATTSNYFEVQTWKEKITVDNDLYSSDAGNEHTETLSMVITTVTGNSSDIINYNNTYKNVNIIDGTCVFRVSPITLDLTNDGQIGVTGETSSIDKDIDNIIGTTVEFDIDGDGKLDTIEWIDGLGDGLLVDNRDGNATNNMDGKRLFGDEGGKYSNGYEKLALLDINNDGQLTDDELTGLNVWIDNGDAKVQDGELKTLAELDITSLSVKMTETTGLDGKMHMESVAVKADGTEIMTEDVWFTSNDIDFSNLTRNDGLNIIDITNGSSDKLNIDMNDVIDLVDSNKELIIKGDLGDKVDLDTPSDWSNTGATNIEGINYNVYQGLGVNSTIKLLIEDDIDVTPDI
jgi:hypothetical protein